MYTSDIECIGCMQGRFSVHAFIRHHSPMSHTLAHTANHHPLPSHTSVHVDRPVFRHSVTRITTRQHCQLLKFSQSLHQPVQFDFVHCTHIMARTSAMTSAKATKVAAVKATKVAAVKAAGKYSQPLAKVHFTSGVPKVQKPNRKLKWVTVSAPAYISGGYPPSLASLIHIHHSLSHTLAHPFIYKSHMRYLDSYTYISACTSHPHTAGGSSHRPVLGEPLGHHPTEPKTARSSKKGLGQPLVLFHMQPHMCVVMSYITRLSYINTHQHQLHCKLL